MNQELRQTMFAVIVGTIAWTIALVVEIARNAPSTSLWICVVGLVFGLVGFLDLVRRSRKPK